MIAANDADDGGMPPAPPGRPPDPATLDLMAYIDGELPPQRVAEIERRLADDPIYAGKLRGLLAVSEFVRDDADRVYGNAQVDGIADQVMARLGRASAPPSAILPLSSVATRRRKNSIIWVSFGVVAAAAAALFLYVRAHDQEQKTANAPAPPQTVAVKTTETPPSKSPATAIEEEAKQRVEGLEVGEGATVIYRSDSTPVVWVTKKDETKDQKSPKK